MIKNKLYSVMDEEGNLGYYLYNESTGEEKLFSIVEEEERMYAKGVGDAVGVARKRMMNKGNKIANKAAKRNYHKTLGTNVFNNHDRAITMSVARSGDCRIEDLKVMLGREYDPVRRILGDDAKESVNRYIYSKRPGQTLHNKSVIKSSKENPYIDFDLY